MFCHKRFLFPFVAHSGSVGKPGLFIGGEVSGWSAW